jgi:hemerythrin-like domain-containing protein
MLAWAPRTAPPAPQSTGDVQMASRANSKAKTDVIEMLMADHQKVKRAFREADKLTEQKDMESLEPLVQQTCAELTVHAEMEEDVFYPAIRKAIKQPELVDEAEVEHASAKELIAQLQQMTSEDDKFAATFKVLGEYVKHHIREEESEMFEQLNRTGIDWEALLQEMQQRRSQLMAEQGLPEESESDEGEPRGRSGARRGKSRRSEEMADEEETTE